MENKYITNMYEYITEQMKLLESEIFRATKEGRPLDVPQYQHAQMALLKMQLYFMNKYG